MGIDEEPIYRVIYQMVAYVFRLVYYCDHIGDRFVKLPGHQTHQVDYLEHDDDSLQIPSSHFFFT